MSTNQASASDRSGSGTPGVLALWQSVLAPLPLGALIHAAGRVHWISPRAADLFQIAAQAWIGAQLDACLPPLSDGASLTLRRGRRALALRRHDSSAPPCGIVFVDDVTDFLDDARAIAAAAERDRVRFARDFHDGLGQQLTGVSLMARSLEAAVITLSEPAARKAKQLARVASGAIRAGRRFAKSLDPTDARGIPTFDALKHVAESRAELLGGICRVSGQWDGQEDEEFAEFLIHFAREMIEILIREAGAHHLQMTLRLDGTHRCLSLDHDGSFAQITPLSLRALRGRARLVGAELNAPADGASSTVELILG